MHALHRVLCSEGVAIPLDLGLEQAQKCQQSMLRICAPRDMPHECLEQGLYWRRTLCSFLLGRLPVNVAFLEGFRDLVKCAWLLEEHQHLRQIWLERFLQLRSRSRLYKSPGV